MSLRLRLLNLVARLTVKPLLRYEQNIARSRRHFELGARTIFRGDRKVRVSRDKSTSGLWVRSRRGGDRTVILYLHGGGYIVGNPQTHRALATQLSSLTGAAVFLPDYRLAPEHPFPAAFEDALAAWRGLTGQGVEASDIILGGDSAGGGLAMALLSELCRLGTPPAGAFAFSPWTDLALTGASLAGNTDSDVLFPADRAVELRDMVAGDADPRDPRLSPLYGDFPDCPPVLLQASETEILRDDTTRLAARLHEFGAAVRVSLSPDAPHVWQMLHGILPEADRSLRELADWIRTLTRSTDES